MGVHILGEYNSILLTMCSLLDACSERVEEHDKIFSTYLLA